MSDPAASPGLRVLHLLNRDHRRGAETFALDLATHMRPLVGSLDVVALQPGAGARLKGVEVLDAGGRRPGRRLRALRRLRQLAREVDVVVAHGSSTLVACAVGLAGTGTPFVYRLIGEPQYWSADRLRRARVRAYLTRAARVAVYYDAAAEVLRSRYGVAPDRLRVIAKGVDPSPFAPTDAGARREHRPALGLPVDASIVLFVGALTPEKDVGQAIDAVARRGPLDGSDAVDTAQPVELVVVGDGPARDELEARARRAQAPVRFVGASSAPATWFAAADVVVLTSRSEGVPSVVIEAGLMGLPVVATDVGGVASVVDDGVTGHLVAVGDVAATATALGRALDDVRGGNAMGARARQRCLERFDIDVAARRWVELLDEVAQERGRRTRSSRAKARSATPR